MILTCPSKFLLVIQVSKNIHVACQSFSSCCLLSELVWVYFCLTSTWRGHVAYIPAYFQVNYIHFWLSKVYVAVIVPLFNEIQVEMHCDHQLGYLPICVSRLINIKYCIFISLFTLQCVMRLTIITQALQLFYLYHKNGYVHH